MNLSDLNAELIYKNLLESVRSGIKNRNILLVGIYSGGVWIAERLHRDLKLSSPLGVLSSAFHRDDYSRRGLPPEVKSTSLPFNVLNADLLLVDDILFTGRTVRAAVNELFDYGRPARIELAVLLDRGGRELPIAPQYCGSVYNLTKKQNFFFMRDVNSGKFSLCIK